jgi:alpha-1,2-mannosyltransferase
MPSRRWLDFDAFYAAGTLAFSPRVVELRPALDYQVAHGLPLTPFLYPPALALVYVPFTWLPFDLAAALHVLLQGAALVGAAILGARVYGIPTRWTVLGVLAWGPAAAGVVSGQNSAVLLLLVVVAADSGLPRSRWLFAGLAVGGVAYRPHLGLPIGALAAWRHAWRLLAVAVGVVAAQYVLGVLATGGAWDWPARWLASVGAETAEDFQSVGWQSLSLPGLLGRLSIGGSTPGALIGPALVGYAAGAAVILLSLRSLREWDAPRAVALTCALALFAGPRGWSYDGTLLLPAVAVVAREAVDRGWPWEHRWLLAAAFGIAALWPLGGYLGVNPEAAVVLLAPFVLLGWGPFRRFA